MTIQIAVKLPDTLAGELDQLVRSGDFKSRSQALRVGLEAMLAERTREQLRNRYREAMAQHPETSQEIAESTRLAREAIAEEPWERWW
jgi:Arc/MetJ-type ribon-helix-helix transcriptional regulator